MKDIRQKEENFVNMNQEEEALAVHKKRRNQARKERRHRVRNHELAAFGEKTPHKTMRGGGQKKKRYGYVGNGLKSIWTYKTEKTVAPG